MKPEKIIANSWLLKLISIIQSNEREGDYPMFLKKKKKNYRCKSNNHKTFSGS